MPIEEVAAKAAGMDDVPMPSKSEDPETGLQRKVTPSRASIPLSRAASVHSNRRSILGTSSIPGDFGDRERDADDSISEYAWGPSHPCFPHQNPHVPLSSPLHESTRIIRIKRDWMIAGDLAPTFANLYPEILDPCIPEDTFRDIIKKINDELQAAFNPLTFRAILDSMLGLATFWLWDDAGLTAVKSRLAALEKWIDHWNHKVGEKEGVRIIPLRRTGYLTLDIQIPDPRIGIDTASFARPGTNDELQTAAPQQHGEFAPYPVAPTLQVTSGSPVAVEGR